MNKIKTNKKVNFVNTKLVIAFWIMVLILAIPVTVLAEDTVEPASSTEEGSHSADSSNIESSTSETESTFSTESDVSNDTTDSNDSATTEVNDTESSNDSAPTSAAVEALDANQSFLSTDQLTAANQLLTAVAGVIAALE